MSCGACAAFPHSVHHCFEVQAGDEGAPADFDEGQFVLGSQPVQRGAAEAGQTHNPIYSVGQAILDHGDLPRSAKVHATIAADHVPSLLKGPADNHE